MLQLSKGIISINDNILFTFPNLIVHSDEIIGIVGDNGAGKTTFFNYIIENIRRKKIIENILL
ncbi:ATP-binding cassette domain-containing protein [Companilactobacillus paralimentarius]|uniref:ATP-binding cassette domain-containing protein n=1 Tax=Companilactobacillus paralimentarius TaxID=83526 RepID=UPI0037E016A9